MKRTTKHTPILLTQSAKSLVRLNCVKSNSLTRFSHTSKYILKWKIIADESSGLRLWLSDRIDHQWDTPDNANSLNCHTVPINMEVGPFVTIIGRIAETMAGKITRVITNSTRSRKHLRVFRPFVLFIPKREHLNLSYIWTLRSIIWDHQYMYQSKEN